MKEWIPISQRSRTKRFELPQNELAKARLEKFQAAIRRFQTENPEVLGATVYGSMIKGRARKKSDIDGFLYIDAEAVLDKDKLKDPKALEKEYRSRLFQSMGIPDREVEYFYHDLRAKLLNSEILDRNIQLDIEHRKVEAKFQQDRKSMSKEEREASEWPRKDRDNDDDFEIGGMFHAKVGSGIERYRKMFLEKLVALSDREEAQSTWRRVYAQITTMEAGTKNRREPRNLEDALQIYHPELYKRLTYQQGEARADELRKDILGKLDQS